MNDRQSAENDAEDVPHHAGCVQHRARWVCHPDCPGPHAGSRCGYPALECGHRWAPRWRVPGQTYGWCETCEAHKRVIPPVKSDGGVA